MPSKPKRPRDPSQLAALIVRESTGDPSQAPAPVKSQAAVDLGRRGGLKGGLARANKLGAARRAEIAKKAAAARWAKRTAQAGASATPPRKKVKVAL